MINYLALITAIAISAVAAYYSIVGLTAIFASAFWSIVLMGSILEVGKLVTASWLYRNWYHTPKLIRYYLMMAIIVLMFITSMGIFGFLSKAHIEQTVFQADNTDKIFVIQQKIEFERLKISDTQKVLTQLDEAVNTLIENDRIRGKDGAIAVRRGQSIERSELFNEITKSNDVISNLNIQINELQKDQRKLEAEIGPLKYIAELIYGKDATQHFESTVRIVIILLVCVFDPLAVVLLVAANMSFAKNKKFTLKPKKGTIKPKKGIVEIDSKLVKNM